ncbi:unnamed protein product [Symbiodinium natans]|uniref:SH3 domain-containing protein n=1 Tax=Symbiodinium natans TaxID=878477 RepID=A0A812UL40_9DINO|nr:unnamed protein product [Symbiodinium natans]
MRNARTPSATQEFVAQVFASGLCFRPAMTSSHKIPADTTQLAGEQVREQAPAPTLRADAPEFVPLAPGTWQQEGLQNNAFQSAASQARERACVLEAVAFQEAQLRLELESAQQALMESNWRAGQAAVRAGAQAAAIADRDARLATVERQHAERLELLSGEVMELKSENATLQRDAALQRAAASQRAEVQGGRNQLVSEEELNALPTFIATRNCRPRGEHQLQLDVGETVLLEWEDEADGPTGGYWAYGHKLQTGYIPRFRLEPCRPRGYSSSSASTSL